MVVLFVLLFLLAVLVITRNRVRAGKPRVIALVLFFAFFQDEIELFLSINFSNLFWKFAVHILIVFLPALLITFLNRLQWLKAIQVTALSFVLILPISRPTVSLARAGENWKARYLPVRYAENISRLAPAPPEIRHRWKKLHTRAMETSSPQINTRELKAMFRQADSKNRILLLNRLREQRHSGLIDEAIRSLEGKDEDLTIASVRYLRTISGKPYGDSRVQWSNWRGSRISMALVKPLGSKPKGGLAERGFSAIQVLDDLYTSKETGEDFLAVYLRKHFPPSISSDDLEALQEAISSLRGSGPSHEYKKGMIYFFLALAETKQNTSGQFHDPELVVSHWNESADRFHAAKDIGRGMAEEVGKILLDADTNRDDRIDAEELKAIIKRRT